MQFSFPRSLRSKHFRASLTETLATRAKRELNAGYGFKRRGTSQGHVALDQAPHVRKREEKISVREKQSVSEASRPIV